MFKNIFITLTRAFSTLFSRKNTPTDSNDNVDSVLEINSSTIEDKPNDPYFEQFANGELTMDQYSEKRRFGEDCHKIMWDNSHNIDHSMNKGKRRRNSSYVSDDDDSALLLGLGIAAFCGDSSDSYSSGE